MALSLQSLLQLLMLGCFLKIATNVHLRAESENHHQMRVLSVKPSRESKNKNQSSKWADTLAITSFPVSWYHTLEWLRLESRMLVKDPCGLCVMTAALSNITFAKLLPRALKHVDEGERLLPEPRERWGHTWLVHDQWHSGGHIKVAVFGPLAVFS